MTNTNLREFFEKISLAQKISALDSRFKDYAGSDIQTSEAIAFFNVFIEHGFIDGEDQNIKLMLDLLKEQNKAIFASSPMTDVFTKLGLMLPKKTKVIQIGNYPE